MEKGGVFHENLNGIRSNPSLFLKKNIPTECTLCTLLWSIFESGRLLNRVKIWTKGQISEVRSNQLFGPWIPRANKRANVRF